MKNPLLYVAAGLIRLYQVVISPAIPPRCKYYPSCSSYALGVLQRHGLAKGTVLALWRLLRCNPWSDGGVDLVPEAKPGHRVFATLKSTAELENTPENVKNSLVFFGGKWDEVYWRMVTEFSGLISRKFECGSHKEEAN